MHVRAQCPPCPHLAQIVLLYRLLFENLFGAPVFMGRRLFPTEGGRPYDDLPPEAGGFRSKIALGLWAPELGGVGLLKPRPKAFVCRNFRTCP